MLTFDHIAVCAATLAEGVAHVERQIGTTPGPGGKHPLMGTHNRLSGLGNGEYLEVIAVDPDAPPPGQPRWFDMDRREGPPRVGNWVARTDDLDAFVASFPAAGEPLSLSRGTLRWRMAVPPDGVLPFDGCFPAVIQWESAPPVFPDVGLSLTSLTLSHPDPDLAEIMARLIEDTRITTRVGPCQITAQLDTGDGPRTLV